MMAMMTIIVAVAIIPNVTLCVFFLLTGPGETWHSTSLSGHRVATPLWSSGNI